MCHVAADGGLGLYQVYLDTCFSQVEGCLHAPDATTNYHNRTNRAILQVFFSHDTNLTCSISLCGTNCQFARSLRLE